MPGSPPIVWVLTSDAIGGDGQSIAIAEALGWPFQRKRIHFQSRMRGVSQYRGRFFLPALAGVDLAASDDLSAPWPDIVIAAGRRQVPVERWLKWRSGGRMRLVHIQRPIAPLHYFDLVICDGYSPRRKNVINVEFPLMRKTAAPDPDYLEGWRRRFEQAPRPWHMLLIGGPAAPFRLDAKVGRDMVSKVLSDVRGKGGSVFISTSRRTPGDVVESIRTAITDDVQLFEWTPDMADNPYVAMLTLGDAAIVTADSVSMMTEAARRGIPVWIYQLPEGVQHRKSRFARTMYGARYVGREDWKSRAADKFRLAGLLDLPDNLKIFQSRFIKAGCAYPFGTKASEFRPPPDELPTIIRRIKSWFATR